MYRPVAYKENNMIQMQQYVIPYADVKECVFDAESKKIKILCDTHLISRDCKEGTISQKPSSVKRLTDEVVIINTELAPEIDFVKEIEEYSKLKVVIESN